MTNEQRRLYIAGAGADPMVKAALRKRRTGRPSPSGQFPRKSKQPDGRAR
jgi:hypothetical protein